MQLKKEVDIILIAIFIILFLGLGIYIGIKNDNGEPIINLNLDKVWGAAKKVVPETTIYPAEAVPDDSEQTKEPFEENPSEIIPGEQTAPIIELKDTKFYPTELTIKIGTTVTWVNKDPKRNYQIYERAMPQRFNSFQLMPSKEFSYTFNETGTYYFSDAIFSYMKGEIVVTTE
jgi:plastocyanin